MNLIIKSIAGAGIALGLFAGVALAASTVVVTPANTQGWSSLAPLADTRPGGTVTFVTDPNPPAGSGALQLTTDVTTTAKAQYMHAENTPLSKVSELSYYTKQVSASFPQGDPSYQLVMCLNGVSANGCNPNGVATPASSFTTLVFEPYQNPTAGPGPVVNNVWQKWDVASGQFWSTRTVVCTGGPVVGQGLTAGGGGAPFYSLTTVKTICPNAVVVGYGVNVGSNNPSYTVRTDLFTFNGTTYNFELANVPTNKNQCKNGGYKNYTDANGKPFKNQGQCVSFVTRGDDNNNDQNDNGNQDGQGNNNDNQQQDGSQD